MAGNQRLTDRLQLIEIVALLHRVPLHGLGELQIQIIHTTKAVNHA